MTRKTSPTQNPARRPPSEQDPEAVAKDADWGFAKSEKEKVLEPRLGLALVACLLLMFGFVLYQKYQSIQEKAHDLVAGQSASEEGPEFDAATLSSPPGAENAAPTGPGGDDGLFDLREPSEPTPTWAEPKPAPASSSLASTTPAGGRSEANPFGNTTEAGTTDAGRSGPPPQTEPDPFGDSARTGVVSSTADGFADADPFFVDEPSTSEQRNSVAFEPSTANRTNSTPAAATWNFGAEQELAAAEQADPDPFAGSAERDLDTSESSEWDLGGSEPQTLHAPDLAMPLPAPNPSPDPFAQAARPPAPPRGESEPNPFSGTATSGKPEVVRESGPTDWSLANTPPPAAQEVSPSAPALPALSAPPPTVPQPSFAGGDWSPSPAPATSPSALSRHEPQSSFGSLGGDPSTGAAFSASVPSQGGKGEHVVGERHLTVTRNDSLWSISQQAYGTARYMPALARYNQDTVPHPDKLPLGTQIRIPPPEVLEARYPEVFRRTARRDAMVAPAGGETASSSQPAQPGVFLDDAGKPHYRVDKSDTLSRIAQHCLGRASRWTEILAMNGDQLQSPESLKPGMVLRLPPDAGRVSVLSDLPLSR